MRSTFFLAGGLMAAALFASASPARADGIEPYAKFTAGAQEQRGLFNVWRKDGKVYLEVAASQLDADFVETIVPGSGLGGNFLVWGNTDHLPAMLVRFHRAGDKVAIVWPNTNVVAPQSAAARLALTYNFPQSVVGVGDVAAEDEKSGAVVFDASALLADVLDMSDMLKGSLRTDGSSGYHLDASKTLFGETKAFPLNDLIEVNQVWSTDASHVRGADIAPDARNLQMKVVYNFAQPPNDGDYRPRYADDRVGLYDAIYLNYDRDAAAERHLRYLVRWNIQPTDPTKNPSPSKHPIVFYLSNTIPERYRPAIREAVLKWNDAFLRIGISDAIEVRDQPADPAWDPDDIRYNVLRWVTESPASFGADSQTLYDPRTGQEFRTGILISADVPREAENGWRYVVDPVRNGRDTDPMPDSFLHDTWLSTILHETGHNLGMQHNFIGHRAYTAKELQSAGFTSRFGIASTVMEYAPTNVWPKPYGNGQYSQTVLGPYDYYAMKYGYAVIPGARTPEDELPTLRRWASAWSDPKYRYASDEDVSWQNGHASDPRVEQGMLTNDELGWCSIQLGMYQNLMQSVDRRFPRAGDAYQDERDAFAYLLGSYGQCATVPAHFVGGQYLSRAHRGDPNAEPPVVPVPKSVQLRALDQLDRYLFSDGAWRVRPQILAGLGYSEWAGYGYVGWDTYGNLPLWAYDPPERHDYPIAQRINRLQSAALDQMLLPLVLQRLDENQLLSTAPTLGIADLFERLQRSIFGDVTAKTASLSLVRRNLQATYAHDLVVLATAPPKGTPADARALARFELQQLRAAIDAALRAGRLDALTRAHLESLREQAATTRPAASS